MLHLLWIIPVVAFIGFFSAAMAASSRRAEDQAEWWQERDKLIVRAKRAEAELWRMAHE